MACGRWSANYTTEASENDSLLGKLNTAAPAAGFPGLGSDTGEESLEPLVIRCETRADNKLSPSTPEPLQEGIPGLFCDKIICSTYGLNHTHYGLLYF
jgi:cohesin complex subunit SCC1